MLTFLSPMLKESEHQESRLQPLGSKKSALGRTLRGISGAVITALVFCLYLATLAPTTLPYDLPGLQDAGVLQVKASVLGIPGFTGYPTWVVLGKLFTYLPFGDVAYRVNLSSAVYAALADYLEDPEPPGLVKTNRRSKTARCTYSFPEKRIPHTTMA